MNPFATIFGVLAALAALVVAVRILRCHLDPEVSRKAVHTGMGLVCLSFPWIFSEPWPVGVLAALAVVALAAVRWIPPLRDRLGGVLGGVGRASLGEFYFPLAVAAVFFLADGDRLLYVIPVLTLTVADTLGALVGRNYGKARYRTDEGTKSAEGSLAFFLGAFLSCHVPLLLFSSTGRAESLLISATAGFIVMLMEAISWRGQDNFIIPIGMFVLLKFYLPLSVADLAMRFGVVAALVATVAIWRHRTTLSDSAVLTGALCGYALWAFGGWWWLFPPLLLFLIYTALPDFPADGKPVQNLHAVTRVMAGGFLWLAAAEFFHDVRYQAAFFLCMAAHTGNITVARLGVVRPELSKAQVLLIAWGIAVVAFGLLCTAGCFFSGARPSTLILLPLSTGLSILIFARLWPSSPQPPHSPRIWISETLVAVVASSIALIPFSP